MQRLVFSSVSSLIAVVCLLLVSCTSCIFETRSVQMCRRVEGLEVTRLLASERLRVLVRACAQFRLSSWLLSPLSRPLSVKK